MNDNKWYLIICDKDLNERVGEHKEPKVINHRVLPYDTKEDLLRVYKKQINKYMKKSYDWKGHSEGAIKFYHGNDQSDILTQLLVYHNGDEVMSGLFD